MPSVWASSPVSYISVTMSQPPTSSPLTNSWGIVGQFEIADSSWRIRGSGRMSTAAYEAPSASSAATVRALKPHMGCSGRPFMKRITSCSEMALAISSRMGLVVSLTGLFRLGDEGQGMDGAADVGSEHRVYTAVLLDAAHPGKLGRDDGGPEVVTGAGQVGHAGGRACDGGLDARLQVVRRGHPTQRVAVATLREVLAGRHPQECEP